MIRIAVEVGQGADRYRVAVRAESIGRALEFVGRQSRGREVKAVFPLDPEAFCVQGVAGEVGGLDREAA